jgi:cell filamentation protein
VSKYQFQQSDIYQPGTDLPINLLNVSDGDVLHAIEAQLLQQAYQTFTSELTPDTRFDQAYFQALHQRTFETLYAWAGRYRTQDMVKGGSMFCRAEYLARESHRIFSELEKENFLHAAGSWPPAQFAARLAYYQSELIALHPFYELNGRITRLFFDMIVIANGYGPIDYGSTLQNDTEVGNNYIRASIDCVQRANNKPLQALILSGLTLVA